MKLALTAEKSVLWLLRALAEAPQMVLGDGNDVRTLHEALEDDHVHVTSDCSLFKIDNNVDSSGYEWPIWPVLASIERKHCDLAFDTKKHQKVIKNIRLIKVIRGRHHLRPARYRSRAAPRPTRSTSS